MFEGCATSQKFGPRNKPVSRRGPGRPVEEPWIGLRAKEVKSEHLWVRNVRDETRVRLGHVWEPIERSTLQRSRVMTEIDFTSCVVTNLQLVKVCSTSHDHDALDIWIWHPKVYTYTQARPRVTCIMSRDVLFTCNSSDRTEAGSYR